MRLEPSQLRELAQAAGVAEDHAAARVGLPAGPVGVTRGDWHVALQERVAEARGSQARSHLVRGLESRWGLALSVWPLARRMASDERWASIRREDREQEALIGAFQAAIRWDPERSQFCSYAYRWMLQHIQRSNERAYDLTVATGAIAQCRRARECSRQHPAWTDEAIAEHTGIPMARVRSRNFDVVSMEQTTSPDGPTIGQTLAATSASVEDAIDAHRLSAQLVQHLTPGQLAALEEEAGERSWVTRARSMGVSRQRIQQLAKVATVRARELVTRDQQVLR